MGSMNCHTKFYEKYSGCLPPKGLRMPGSILFFFLAGKHPSCILPAGVKYRASSSLIIPLFFFFEEITGKLRGKEILSYNLMNLSSFP